MTVRFAISEKLKTLVRQFGKDLVAKQTEFAALYAQACVEFGGHDWQTKSLEDCINCVQRELKAVLVGEDIWPEGTFAAYCAAARDSLVFGIPFRLGVHCRVSHLNETVKEFQADKSDDSVLTKYKRAMDKVRRQHARQRVSDGSVALPMMQPNEDPERFAYRFCKVLVDYASQDCLAKATPALRKLFALAKLVVETQEEVVVRLVEKRAEEAAEVPAA